MTIFKREYNSELKIISNFKDFFLSSNITINSVQKLKTGVSSKINHKEDMLLNQFQWRSCVEESIQSESSLLLFNNDLVDVNIDNINKAHDYHVNVDDEKNKESQLEEESVNEEKGFKLNSEIVFKNKIIKLKGIYSIFNTSSKILISLNLTGESSIYIFLRCNNIEDTFDIDNTNIFIKISKQIQSNRKFLELGRLVLSNKGDEKEKYVNMKIFKKQEIPKHDGYSQSFDSSYCSIILNDSKESISVEYYSEKNFKKKFEFEVESNLLGSVDIHNPNFKYIGLVGDMISVNRVCFQNCDRVLNGNNQFDERQNCSCCFIY